MATIQTGKWDQTDFMEEKLESIKRSNDIKESYNKHDNNNDNNYIDNVGLIMNRSQRRHIFVRLMDNCHFVFAHYIGAFWTLNSVVDKLFYHCLHRFCENMIKLIIVLLFTTNEFNFLFDKSYNNRDVKDLDNSYILVYFTYQDVNGKIAKHVENNKDNSNSNNNDNNKSNSNEDKLETITVQGCRFVYYFGELLSKIKNSDDERRLSVNHLISKTTKILDKTGTNMKELHIQYRNNLTNCDLVFTNNTVNNNDSNK